MVIVRKKIKELLEKRHLLIKNPYLLAAMASYSGNKEVAKSILGYIWRNVDKDHIDYYLLSNITESIANGILDAFEYPIACANPESGIPAT